MSYNAKVRKEQNPDRLVVASGGSLDVESGGELDIESGASLKLAGTAITSTAAELNALDGITATVAELNQYAVTCQIDDISSAASFWVVAPHAGTIAKVYTVINGAISVADAVITLEIGGTLVTGSTVTIATASSAAGDVDSSTPSAANTVTAGQAIEVITDGGSTGTVKAEVTILITR
jgi:hypothetical protein